MRLGVVAAEKAIVTVDVDDGSYVRVKIAVQRLATKVVADKSDAIISASDLAEKFRKYLPLLIHRAGSFFKVKEAYNDDIMRLRMKHDVIPAIAQCHACQELCPISCKCMGCFQAIYCCREECPRQRAIELHEPMCAMGFWCAEVEFMPECSSCGKLHPAKITAACTKCRTAYFCSDAACAASRLRHQCGCNAKSIVWSP